MNELEANVMRLVGKVVEVEDCKGGVCTQVVTPSPDGFQAGIRCSVFTKSRKWRKDESFDAPVVPGRFTRLWVDKKTGEQREERFPTSGFFMMGG